MALPILVEQNKLDPSQKIQFRSVANDSKFERIQSLSKIERVNQSKKNTSVQSSSIEKVKQNSRANVDAINQRAIEKSQKQSNPMIPLIHSMNGTLMSMDGTLKSILTVLKKQTDQLNDSLEKTGLGDSSFNRDKNPRRRTARDRLRERHPRRRDRANLPGRVRRGIRAHGRGMASGVATLASLFGLNQIIPDEVQDVFDAGSTGADVVESVRGAGSAGVRGAAGAGEAGAEAGGLLGRFGKMMGTGAKFLSKAAVPLTVGLSLYENSDEFLKTGKVDPIKQLEKTGGGLANLFNPQDTEDDQGGLHLMKRLNGAGEVISGATGTVLGAGTQVGAAIQDLIPPDFSDSIVDGIVGLFGGETNADREKKRKEFEDTQKKAAEEAKKIREAEEAKKIQASGSSTPTVNPSSNQTINQINDTKQQSTEEALKLGTTPSVSIVQPEGKPIPVFLTDEKGKPYSNALSGVPGSSVVPGLTMPSLSDIVSPSNQEEIAKLMGVTKDKLSNISIDSVAQSLGIAPKDISSENILGFLKEKGADAGQMAGYLVNQQNSTKQHEGKPAYNPFTQSNEGTKRTNSPTMIAAQEQASQSDAMIPSNPSPQSVMGQQALQPGINKDLQTMVPSSSGKRIISGSYTPTDEDKKYFKGDLSKLKGMDPVFVEKLKAASAEAGVQLPLTSGFRSQEKQDQLRAEAVKKYGSEEAASKWVAKTSIHTTGNAADFSMGGDAKKFWSSNPKLVEAMEKQGLHRPLDHEAWHWESDITKGESRKGLAAKLIEQRKESLANPQKSPTNQMVQDTSTGVAGVLASQGVPGASGVMNQIQKGGKSFSAGVESAISAASKATNVPLSYMRTMAEIESSGKADAHRPNSKYTGLYQFDQDTANSVGVSDRNDPNQAAMGAAKLAQKNIQSLKNYGIDVDINKNPELVYLAHQQGAKGASDIIKAAQTGAPISEKLRRTIDANGGKGMSPAQFLEHWKTTYHKKAGVVGHTEQKDQSSQQESNQVTAKENKNIIEQATGIAKEDLTAKNLEGFTKEKLSEATGIAQEDLTAEKMLGFSKEKMTEAGQLTGFMVNQQNSTSQYKNKPAYNPFTHTGGPTAQSRGQQGVAPKRSNSAPQEALQASFAKNTVSGLTPEPSSIPMTYPIPEELKNADQRTLQNYQLSLNPNVQASINSLQAGGISIGSGVNAVDQIRKTGGLDPMINGDLHGVLSKVSPQLTAYPGLQSVFNQSLSGERNLSGLQSTQLTPQFQNSSYPLESAGLNDQQNNLNISSSHNQPMSVPTNSGSSSAPARGSHIMSGDGAPLEVRNSESSIRKLCDALMAFSFG